MTSVRHFSDLARDFSSSRPSRSAGVLARWLSALTSPLGAMLSPLSAVLDGSSTMDGSDAITFMSGSGATGSTISGSSPGCQRSMFSGEPSDELPKNRLELSRGGAGATASMVSGALFISSSGWASSDIDTSKCASGGALSASANSGSSLAGSGAGMAAAVFAPITDALEVDGSSLAGAAASLDAGATVSGDTVTSRSPFNVRSTLGKSE